MCAWMAHGIKKPKGLATTPVRRIVPAAYHGSAEQAFAYSRPVLSIRIVRFSCSISCFCFEITSKNS